MTHDGLLGLGDITPHPSALRFGATIPPAPPPVSVDWHTKMALSPTDALANDRIGNCVPCGKLRLAQMRMANAWGSAWKPTADMATQLYSAWTGYNAVTGQPDQGTDIATAQGACAMPGLDLGLQAPDVSLPCMVNSSDLTEVRRAIDALVGVGICLALPTAWKTADVWDIGPTRTGDWAPGSWGNHLVCSGKYDADWVSVISWGYEVPMTWRAFATYVLSVPAGLSRSALDWRGISPAGLTFAQSQAAEAEASG